MKTTANIANTATVNHRHTFPQFWLKRTLLTWLLWPFSGIFFLITCLRRYAYQFKLLPSYRSTLPLIVVGNITVGGTGKTPVVILLTAWLQQQGYRPGIISRGYKSQAKTYPMWVTPATPVNETGDEPLLLATRTGCPVVIDACRKRAVQLLQQSQQCDIIISDDGLQHYALQRDMEIIVIDGVRRFGNGFLLPAGMLREPIARCKKAQFIICNGGIPQSHEWPMQIHTQQVYALANSSHCITLAELKDQTLHAVAGIGHPERFFNLLRQAGLTIIEHAFPDHHVYTPADFDFVTDGHAVILTEKDAVKCCDLIYTDAWCVAIDAELPPSFFAHLKRLLKR